MQKNAKHCKGLALKYIWLYSHTFFMLFLLNVFVLALEQHHIDEGTFSVD